MSRPEFDQFSASYEDLLKDPIRDRFGGPGSTFFHTRKRDLILDYFRCRGIETRSLSFLDVGCGKGELASMLRSAFGRTAGCDPSTGMLDAAQAIETRVQEEPGKIPYGDAEFDVVSAVCVYHHVPPESRASLTREVRRILKPGGVCIIVEHNPYNPLTRLIVSRTPVDADAILLQRLEAETMLRAAGFVPEAYKYFLYFPESIYRRAGDTIENWLAKVPFGGQYAVFAKRVDSLPETQ